MPFSVNSFDAVFYFGVLHHIDVDLRHAVMRESIRVTRDTGAVVFFEPTPKTLENLWTKDPSHPQAANPDNYLEEKEISKTSFMGEMMQVYIYKKNV